MPPGISRGRYDIDNRNRRNNETKRVMKNKLLITCAMAALMVSGYSCKKGGIPAREPEGTEVDNRMVLSPGQVEANGLTLGRVADYEFREIVGATGFLEPLPLNRRSVSTLGGGILQDLKRLPGDRVRAGEQLFRLVNPALLELQKEFLTSVSELEFLEEEYKRQEKLAGEKVSAEKVYSRARGDYLAAKARTDALRNQLVMQGIAPEKVLEGLLIPALSVTAPISGYVTRVAGTNGKAVEPGAEIMEITATSSLLLRLEVFEKDILSIREGQAVFFTLPGLITDTLEAKVLQTGRVLGENRTTEVFALVNVADTLRLLPGMFVKAAIVTGRRPAKAVPLSAVIGGEENRYVLVKTGNAGEDWLLSKKKVHTGLRDERMVEILQDGLLLPGDQIVVNGAFALSAL